VLSLSGKSTCPYPFFWSTWWLQREIRCEALFALAV